MGPAAEHMHCIWMLPRESSDFSMRWSLIKAGFSRRAKSLCHVDEWMDDSKRKHRETTIRQRRFREHQIRDEREYQVYMDYTHFNPVKHRLVKRVVEWPYSSFHRYVRLGICPDTWGGVVGGVPGFGFGE